MVSSSIPSSMDCEGFGLGVADEEDEGSGALGVGDGDAPWLDVRHKKKTRVNARTVTTAIHAMIGPLEVGFFGGSTYGVWGA